MVNPVLVENSQDLDDVGRIGSADEASPTKPWYVLSFDRFRFRLGYFQSHWQEMDGCGEIYWQFYNSRHDFFMNVLRKLSLPRNFHNSDANHIGQRTLQAKTNMHKVRNTIYQILSERMRQKQVGLCRSGKISTRQQSHQRQPSKYLATLNIYSITGPRFKGKSTD